MEGKNFAFKPDTEFCLKTVPVWEPNQDRKNLYRHFRVITILKRRQAQALFRKLIEVERKLERANLAEFMEMLQNPVRLIFLNFLAGLARGFGIAIGLTIIASLFILLLYRLASLNLPVIGKYIADLVRIVNQHLRLYS